MRSGDASAAFRGAVSLPPYLSPKVFETFSLGLDFRAFRNGYRPETPKPGWWPGLPFALSECIAGVKG